MTIIAVGVHRGESPLEMMSKVHSRKVMPLLTRQWWTNLVFLFTWWALVSK